MASTTTKWVIGGVAAVAVLLLISEHNNQSPSGSSGLFGGQSCTVTATVDSPLRSKADSAAPLVGTLSKGAAVLAERTVSNGYRQLGPSIWAAQEDVQPTPGSDCG